MLGQEDWQCPTCLDLLFKPAVNSCGHVFCFWCFHKAMSPYTPSACPVCRTKYGHLPAICGKLHRFLTAQFPQAAAQRRQETEAEERQYGAACPEPDTGPLPLPEAPGAWLPAHFTCDHPRCGKLLCRPVVLNCGHVVCGTTCLGSGPGGGGGRGGSGQQGYECPACGMAARQAPAVCMQLGDLLAELFPEDSRQRELECRQEVERRQQAAAEAAAAAAAAAAAGEGQDELTTPRVAAASAAAAAGGAGDTAAQQQPAAGQQQQQTLSPTLASALQRRAAAGGPGQALAQRLEENLQRLTAGDSYVHHGVGCDGCGLYPIQGQRYQCRDCPDAMGFDLCGACMGRGLSNIVGRFNQRHTPEHSMQLVRPRVTAMHMLQAANPELPMDQLMWLLELTLASAEEEEEEQDTPPPPPPPTGRQQGQQQEQEQGGGAAGSAASGAPGGGGAGQGANGSSGGGGGIIWLRRGPRPAYDPTATEPSPSAYRQPPQQQQQQQQLVSGESQGLIDGVGSEQADAGGTTVVHVPLENVLPGGGQGTPT